MEQPIINHIWSNDDKQMTPKQREKQFKKFLACKFDLFIHFRRTYDRVLFENEFTFDNWLKGNIGKRMFQTSFKSVKPKIFGKEYETTNDIMIGHEYSIYRFVNYNFKTITYKFK